MTTANVNKAFLEAQRLMAKHAEEEASRRIEEAELVQDTVQRFAAQCVINFAKSSVLLNLFIKLGPDRLQKSSESGPDKAISGSVPKEPFTRSEEPLMFGVGETWAEWNDVLCLQSISSKPSGPIEDVEAIAAQMSDDGTLAEAVLAAPMMRKYYTGLSRFRPATAEERDRFRERLNLAGWWMGIPVFRMHLVPEHEIWLMNLSGAFRLIEYLNAKVQVGPVPDRPSEVLLKFSQRTRLVVDCSTGLARLKSEDIS